ncbi:hypothetical protein [Rhodoferax sp.]|uniref:hypothetical protein n=1 Tax=Rhodoferax sp. TaxID=50421 RepID=UPI00284C560F|nr:hypothetical protein [Rhodoferax sp.]MDR3368320.1 hypothetical protein [Rhodoferax sp.]
MNSALIRSVFYTACLTLAVSACTTQAWYEGMKQGAVNQCDKQPPGAREDCLSRLNNKTYDAYNKERATAE